MGKRASLILLCLAVAVMAYVALDFWTGRNAPYYKRFERQWREDVRRLEKSGKMPKFWFDVGEVVVTGGTADTRSWLQRIQVPVVARKNGNFKLDILVVAWEENGKIGALVQYNVSDRNNGNGMWELGRTLILDDKTQKRSTWQAFLRELRL
jgi:hypothetical protein